MTYKVNFQATGYTAPSPDNPKGIKVKASGCFTAQGERPESNRFIPFAVIVKCREAFLAQCQCVRLSGDRPNVTSYPVVWLPKPKAK